MLLKYFSIVFLSILSGCLANYQYNISTFKVPLDHFSFANNITFSIRYLTNDTWDLDHIGPIFFYTGNEGDIELFAQNTGLMWELAPKFKAEVVFAEHRYYGKSLPFGNDSYSSPEKLGYLTSEQALADYADLLTFLNKDHHRHVIAFGGSYGGMLAAWFRMKYPHLVTGALAASAPIRQFEVECNMFNRILTSVYRTALPDNPNCSINIGKVWDVMKQMMGNDKTKLDFNKKFNFCKTVNTTQDLDTFFEYLNDVLGNLAMVNYAYPSSFLAPLPAYPVRQFCYELEMDYTKNSSLLLDAFKRALTVYTGKVKCLDISSAYDSSMGDLGWNFQACTEMVWANCQNGTTDMFPPLPWNFQEYSDECYKKFKISPQTWGRNAPGETLYGGSNINGASNIIFSNGLLDPWSGGGLFTAPMNTHEVYIVIIPEGAHHLDLRSSNEEDPESVTEARKKYVKIFRKWIPSNRKSYHKY